MSKALRVVVPPHPLIGHWLTLLRDQQTPPALFASAMAELGRWLTYEAIRDWIPYQRVMVNTPLASTEGTVVDGTVPLLAVPLLRAGLGLWEGARPVLPNAAVAHMGFMAAGDSSEPACYLDALPQTIPANAGVLVFAPMVASADAEVLYRGQLSKLSGWQGDNLMGVLRRKQGAVQSVFLSFDLHRLDGQNGQMRRDALQKILIDEFGL